MKPESSELSALRNLARGRVHGGYRWALVMSDGALLCETCTRSEYRQVFRATRDRSRDGWAAQAITHSGEHDGPAEYCAHCSCEIFAATDEDDATKLDVIDATAPSAWASYLINGDASGLEDAEQRACDDWVASLAPYTYCVSAEDAGFKHWHDARQFAPYGADCQTYIFQNVEGG